MNNKSFYSIVALMAIVDLVLVIRPWVVGSMITRSIMCGAALYYVVHRVKSKQDVSALMIIMSILAVLINPIAPFQLPIWAWCIIDGAALGSFFFLSRSIPLVDEDGHVVKTKEWPGHGQPIEDTVHHTEASTPLETKHIE